MLISFKRFSAHCKVHRLSAMSCAKTAEPIEMLFGLWAWMDPMNHVLDESRSPHGK